MSIFPNVPNVPGVPPLLRNPLATASAAVALLRHDSAVAPINPVALEWGIFDKSGNSVIDAQSVVSYGHKKEWKVATFQVEPNAFSAYDVVAEPFDARMSFTCGGSKSDRENFLQSIEAIAGTTTLYDIHTPERTYLNASVHTYAYDRTFDRGAGLLKVDLTIIEIRVAQAPAFSSTATPSGANPVSIGAVSTLPATQVQESSMIG